MTRVIPQVAHHGSGLPWTPSTDRAPDQASIVSIDRSTDHARTPPLRRVLVWIGIGIALTVATVVVLVGVSGTERVLTALRAMNPAWLLTALGLEVVALACLTQVYREVFRVTHGPLPVREALVVSLGSFSLAQTLPGGGAAGAIFAANRLARRSDAVTGTTSAVLFGTTTMATLGLIVSTGATATALATGEHAGVAVAAGAVTLVFVAALVAMRWLLSRPRLRRRLVAWAARVTRRPPEVARSWQEAIDQQADLLRHPERLWRIVAWSAINWSIDIAVMGLIAYAVGVRTPVLAIVAAYGVANLVNGLPLTPGGIGLVEAGVAGTLTAMGADAGAASLTAIAYRLVAHWFPVLLSAPFVLTHMRTWPSDGGPGGGRPGEEQPSDEEPGRGAVEVMG